MPLEYAVIRSLIYVNFSFANSFYPDICSFMCTSSASSSLIGRTSLLSLTKIKFPVGYGTFASRPSAAIRYLSIVTPSAPQSSSISFCKASPEKPAIYWSNYLVNLALI